MTFGEWRRATFDRLRVHGVVGDSALLWIPAPYRGTRGRSFAGLTTLGCATAPPLDFRFRGNDGWRGRSDGEDVRRFVW